MTASDAYSALLVQHPPASTAIAGGAAALLGAGIPGVALSHVAAGVMAVDSGVRWGTIVGSLAAFVGGLVGIGFLRLVKADPSTRRRAALWMATTAVIGPVTIVASAVIGGWLARGYGLDEMIDAAGPSAPHVWPVIAVSVLLAAAMAADSHRD